MKRTLITLTLLAATACSSGSVDGTHIGRADLGDAWPLTVEEGTLACNGSGGVGEVFFTAPEGTAYAVNGAAKSNERLADVTPIWADNPDINGLKKDIGPLIDKGLALCE